MNEAVAEQRKMLAEWMGEAAENLLATVTADQRDKLLIPFDDENRFVWHYTPIERQGLTFNEMDYAQRRLANQLVALGLSETGYGTAAAIIGLELALDAREKWATPKPWRDSRDYYLSLFAEPQEKEPWGWRFEGHHLSLNFTIVDGILATPTPMFFGANPADSALNHLDNLRPLGAREDLARDLVHALTAEQKAKAIMSPVAPADMITANVARLDPDRLSQDMVVAAGEQRMSDAHRKALHYSRSPKGLAVAGMRPDQKEIMSALVKVYLDCLPPRLAEIEGRMLPAEALFFAWAGGLEKRQPHYYRIQGKRFLIEYDNTQDGANHIHSVWRDSDDDFGAQLLSRHYAQSH